MSKRVCALISLFITVVLMALGAYLHDTKRAIACPSWPLCPGKFTDQGLIYFHRMLALSLITISGYLSFTLGKQRDVESKWAHWFFLLVIVQALLGALTAVMQLPAVISFIHLLLSLVTLALIVVLHDSLDSNPTEVKGIPLPWLKDGLLGILILFFFQSLLGSLVRHTGAGAECGVGIDYLLVCKDKIAGGLSWWPLGWAAQLNVLHRASGILLFCLGLPVLVLGFFNFNSMSGVLAYKARNGALVAIVFLFIQVYSGFYNIASELAVHAKVVHLVFAAILLIFVLKTRLYQLKLERASFGAVQISRLGDMIELFKPRLAGLVMLTMLIGSLLTPGRIYFLDIFIASFFVFMVVASATTLNCWMEREIDAKMERTKHRALPAGRMGEKTALAIGLFLALVALPTLYFLVNPLTALLALTAHLCYLLAYTPLKKYSALALYVGAIPGALPPMMGWTAITGSMDVIAWLLFAILFVWQLPHFLAISIYYRGDYEAAGLKIFAEKNNFKKIMGHIFFYTAILALCAMGPRWWADFSRQYEICAIVLSLLFLSIAGSGFWVNSESNDSMCRWARLYFFASIIYLPLLLVALVFFK